MATMRKTGAPRTAETVRLTDAQPPKQTEGAATAKQALRGQFLWLWVLPVLVWVSFLAFGLLSHSPLAKNDVQLRSGGWRPLFWFDRYVFAKAGTLLPLVPFALRAVSRALTPLKRYPTTLLYALLWYGGVFVIRLILYNVHLQVQRATPLEFQYLSDHVFLAASVTASLQAEAVLAWQDFQAQIEGPVRQTLQRVAGMLPIVASAGLFLLVSGDACITARYYHHPPETVVAVMLGFLLFHLPVISWLEPYA